MMVILPPELYLKVIEEVIGSPNPEAYQIEGVPTLANLSLVNHTFHEWCTPMLYTRVSLTCKRVRLFCRTVVQDWHLGSNRSATTHPVVASPLGQKVKSLAFRRGGSLDVPLDEIVAILNALKGTLERLMINPAELIDARATSEGWEGDWGNPKLEIAIKKLQNLREFCNFQLPSPFPSPILPSLVLPIASSSTLKRLTLLSPQLPYRLPHNILSFGRLESLAIVHPQVDLESSMETEAHTNLLTIIDEISNLNEVTIFVKTRLPCEWFLPMEPLDESGTLKLYDLEDESVTADKIKFTMLSRPSEWKPGDWVVEAMLLGDFWTLERISVGDYSELIHKDAVGSNYTN